MSVSMCVRGMHRLVSDVVGVLAVAMSGQLGMHFMTVIVAAEDGTGVLIADEDQERFQQIPEFPAGRPAVLDLFSKLGEEKNQDQTDNNLEDHILRDCEARLLLVEIA